MRVSYYDVALNVDVVTVGKYDYALKTGYNYSTGYLSLYSTILSESPSM